MKKLNITEIFYSLQGEGPFMGVPAVFVRLANCVPPYCSFCDTPHSLKDGYDIEVIKLAEEICNFQCKLIVITGGEPFLQWDNGLKELEDILCENGYQVQYETSGKVKIEPSDNERTVICSPKQIGDFKSNEWAFIPENVSEVTSFKFIYDDNEEQIQNFIDQYEIPNQKLFLMPEGKTKEEQMRKMEATWDTCARNHWKFSPRLHILTFDQKAGV